MVVDAGKMVPNLDFLVLSQASHCIGIFTEQPSHILGYLIKRIKLLIVLLEHIGVNFVDKHFKNDVGVNLVSYLDDLVQLVASRVFVRFVSVYHVDEGPTALQRVHITYALLVQLFGSWKVFDLKLDVGVVVYICTLI